MPKLDTKACAPKCLPICTGVLALAVVVLGFLAFNKQTPCYDVVAGSTQPQRVLLNKCSGDTWVLVQQTVVDKEGKNTGQFMYKWFPAGKEFKNQTLLMAK